MSVFQSFKNRIFQQGLTHNFGQKARFCLFLLLFKIILEIIFNSVLNKKEAFLE